MVYGKIRTRTRTTQPETPPAVPRSSKFRVPMDLYVDFDAVSAWLGTGAHPDYTMPIILRVYSPVVFAYRGCFDDSQNLV